MYPGILVNYYLKPSRTRPYYFITQVNKASSIQTGLNELEKLLNPCADDDTIIEDTANTGLRMEIRCGNQGYIPKLAYVDYLKKPKIVNLTYADLDGIDQTEELEFPDYVCYEILNELVKLVLENSSDPRLQTNVPINQTILATQDSQ